MGNNNLYQKIQAVSNDIKNIEKDMQVGTGNYSYKAVSDIAVTTKVKESETMHGIISIPIKQEHISSDIVHVQKKEGESIIYVDNIKMTLRIIDIENPSNFIDIESFGKGVDSGDKGFGKASTYARKYALLNAYKIATGEDPDSEKSKEEKTPSINDIKKTVIDFLLRNTEKRNAVLSHFNLGSVDDLSKKQIEMCFDKFKKSKEI